MSSDEDADCCAATYRAGGQDALRASTYLATMLADRRTIEALRTLLYILDGLYGLDESERASQYWKTHR